jgi:quercetin dioxygenase-like cupin family protein
MPIYKIFEMEKLREDASPEAEIQRVRGDLMKAGIVVYKKDKGAPPHSHPNDEQFNLILEGRRVMILDGEVAVAGPGDLIHIRRNSVHGGGRSLDEQCVFFAVKSPAGSGVMGEDYQGVDNADELVQKVDQKVEEIRAAEA